MLITLLFGAAVTLGPGCSRHRDLALGDGALRERLKGAGCDRHVDSAGVEHVRPVGKAPETVWACFGYVHGRDRSWQMDHLRRIAQGRRAEIYGPSQAKSDFSMRLLGLSERSIEIFGTLSEPQKNRLRAYAHGVNRGFEDALKAGVTEFRTLGYRPDDWMPWDALSLLLLQSFDQTRQTFENDIDEHHRLQLWKERARQLFEPDGIPWETTIIKKSELRAPPADYDPAQHPGPPSVGGGAKGRELFGHGALGTGGGSNNWVLGPSRSRTGHAWLANDPHLDLKRPVFWHWVHVDGPDWDAIGGSLPGVPVIASGANRRVAWGLTNSYLDVADVVDADRAGLKGVTRHLPVIWIRWGFIRLPYFFKSFERTREGWPLLPLPEVPEGRAWVLRWSGFDVGARDFEGLLDITAAQSAQEADAKFSGVGLPSWNFVFADVDGHIGYRAIGLVPKRTHAPPFGLTPQSEPGALTERPLLSPREMPSVFDPPRGFVATANNRQWPASHLLQGGRAYSPGFRAFRIEELLGATRRHDLESQRRVQCDVQAVDARFLLPRMIAALPSRELDAKGREALALLRDWSRKGYPAELDCRACGVYRLWVNALLDRELDEIALYRLIERPDADEISRIRQALMSAIEGSGLKPWGELHVNPFRHLSGDPRFAARVALPTPGDTHSVNPGTGDWKNGRIEQRSGASQRLIVELANPPVVHVILPGPNVRPDQGDASDPAKDEFSSPGSSWLKWRDCELERRQFPLDWSGVTPSRVSL